mgnify:CR=1 FL=1
MGGDSPGEDVPASTPRLTQRGGVLSCRMAVPQHLTANVGRAGVTISLGTSDRLHAKPLCGNPSDAPDQLFESLPRITGLSQAGIEERIRGYRPTRLIKGRELAFDLRSAPLADADPEIAGLREASALDASLPRIAAIAAAALPSWMKPITALAGTSARIAPDSVRCCKALVTTAAPVSTWISTLWNRRRKPTAGSRDRTSRQAVRPVAAQSPARSGDRVLRQNRQGSRRRRGVRVLQIHQRAV